MSLYQRYYENIYFPFFESVLKRRKTASLFNMLLETQWKPYEEIREFQLKELKALLIHAERHCIYYRKIFDKYGFGPEKITKVEDIRVLPIIDKDIIRNNKNDLKSNSGREPIWKKSTGGSTGQPLQFLYTPRSYSWRMATSKRGYSSTGARPGTKQAYIWGSNLGVNASSKIQVLKEKLNHIIDRQRYYDCFRFDESAMAACLEDMNRYKPQFIVGYTNPLYKFAQYVKDGKGRGFQPEAIICAAEKLLDFQRDTIESAFECKAYNTYGSREFMLIASECEKREGLHISMENLVVEVVRDDGSPAEEGETGRIVITDLHNYGMPFIRYEIGDMASYTKKMCSCGRGLPVLAEVTGRTLDIIRSPDGNMLAGEFFPRLMREFEDIKQYQVIQNQLDELIVKLVFYCSQNVEVMYLIEREIRKVMGNRIKIKFEITDEIPLTMTGKHRITISNLR